MGKKEIEHIYPLTIVKDRYGGGYSKGHYLAFNLEPWDVPEDINGSDVDCICFWDDDAKEYAIGKGDTAQEAIDDLARKLQPAENANNMEKYLFLDFDGVLNTGKYARQMKREGIDPFDEFGAMFDPEAIANLKHIVELTGCKIILSSTWRNEGIMRMRKLWKERGLPGEIYSMTPMMGFPLREAKALEINAWLDQNAGRDYRYVILDDEDYFFPKQQEHLVLTDDKEGLTDRKAQNAIWILNN